MAYKECPIETWSKEGGVSFSDKGEELVFGLDAFKALIGRKLRLGPTASSNEVERELRGFCRGGGCGLCRPIPEIRESTFRIRRLDYKREEAVDFFGVERFTFGNAGERVAIADDDKDMATTLGRILSKRGYVVDVLVPGRRKGGGEFGSRDRYFAEMMLTYDPVAVVSDKGLGPNYDGIGVLAHVKAKRSNVLTFMLTGESDSHEFARAEADVFRTKPVSIDDLEEVIRNRVQYFKLREDY